MPEKKSKTSSPSSPRNHSEIANRYCADVVSGKILANKFVKLACQRHLDDLQKSADESYPYIFDEKKAARICRFIEQLPHVKGKWNSATIKLEPWQCFILCAPFGWVKRDSGLRRFRTVYIKVPRKNGKSAISAGVGLYMLCADSEPGAVVYVGATSEKQATEVAFEPAKLMVEKCPQLQRAFGVQVNAKSIVVLKTASKLVPLIAKPGDGGNPSCAIIDEYHEHVTDHLVDCMDTGMGARRQPLLWEITTAGSSIEGPCHAQEREVEQMLERIIQRDDLFGICYGIDKGEDWASREALIKANPNFGVSVFEDFLVAQQNAAIQSTRKQNTFKTKHLDEWVGAATAWMNSELWRKCGDSNLKPEDFIGSPCFGAGDLASKLDLTAIAFTFRKRIEAAVHYYAFVRCFCPESRLGEPELEHYRTWHAQGFLETTPGNVIDYDYITKQTSEDVKRFKAQQFGFDPWNAEQFAQGVKNETGVEIVEIQQQPRYLSEPMKQLEALVIAERLHHDGNPLMAWMMSNVVAKVDAKDNIFPRKEREEAKIDGPVALINALSRAILNDSNESIYEERGVRWL